MAFGACSKLRKARPLDLRFRACDAPKEEKRKRDQE